MQMIEIKINTSDVRKKKINYFIKNASDIWKRYKMLGTKDKGIIAFMIAMQNLYNKTNSM